MGSPLALILANIFMGFYESKRLNEYNLSKPKFYLRYVDDILATFDKEQDSLSFLNLLSKRHPNIKLRLEKQINQSLVNAHLNWSQSLILVVDPLTVLIGFINFLSFVDVIKMSTVSFLVQVDSGILSLQNAFLGSIIQMVLNLKVNRHLLSLGSF